jgi:hypothetical protein
MSTDDDGDELRPVLWVLLEAVVVGYWREVLRPPGFAGHAVAGPGHLVRWATAVRLVAQSMQLQARGRLHDAWLRLAEAAALLPPQLVRRDADTGAGLAVLRPEPPDTASADEKLVVALARLVWREQSELVDLRTTFAPDRMKARDELVEALIQYLIWVEFDPSTYHRVARGEPSWDGVVVDRSRKVLCRRGTEIRWFADPTASVELSQAPWQDIGGYRGLCAVALDLLAARRAPAPWCGQAGTSGLVVRRARLRAWQYARRWKEDLDSYRIQTLE